MSSLVIAEIEIGTSCRRSLRLVAVTMISCSTCISRGVVGRSGLRARAKAAVVSRAVNGNQAERWTAVMWFSPLQQSPCGGFSEFILNFPYGSIFLLVLFFS